jgi:hypothetical protein
MIEWFDDLVLGMRFMPVRECGDGRFEGAHGQCTFLQVICSPAKTLARAVPTLPRTSACIRQCAAAVVRL